MNSKRSSRKMPSLGPEPRKSPLPFIFASAAVVGLIAGGAFWLGRRSLPAKESTKVSDAPKEETAPPSPTVALPTPTNDGGQFNAPPPQVTKPITASAHATPVSNWRSARIDINGPLESAVVSAVGQEIGPSLTQVITRTLVWWIDVPKGLVKGDVLHVLFEERNAQEPIVYALRFHSRKLDKELEAYRFQTIEGRASRFYIPEGKELEERLVPSPLDEYEQITSLLRDGRKHKGVDFKTDVGTVVKSTINGTITRRNWNFRSNGNCLEVTDNKTGNKFLFLHLSELDANSKVGTKVKIGQPIARSGNSGRSFAPHLHYQIMRGENPIDPFKIHHTTRRALEGEALVKFKARTQELKSQWTRLATAGQQ